MGKLVKDITSIEEDFSKWYTDVVVKAELIDYYDVRGCNILRPYGYAIWENIIRALDEKFKDSGVENVMMPLLIPESLLEKEKDHIKGFAPEVAWVTQGGDETLQERLCIRPTSEVVFCSHFKRIVHSWRDLPKLYNQWCSIVRWEKTSRPFLRSVEIHWQEGHTLHETGQEANNFALKMLKVYADFYREVLCIPVILGQKTESEKFAGAEKTYTVECMMKDGKALQSGTTHYFKDGFSRAFDVKFTNRNNQEEYAYQTSFGLSSRSIAAVIMVHGDDDGLVLPPDIAPIQVVIIPINFKDNIKISGKSREVFEILRSKFRVKIDDSDQTPGWKFANYEMKGVPIRVEIGPKDVESGKCVVVRRDNRKKFECDFSCLDSFLERMIVEMKKNMYDSALKFMEEKTVVSDSKEIFKNFKGFVKIPFCETADCEDYIKKTYGFTSRCIPFQDEKLEDSVCPICGKRALHYVYFAKAY